MPFTIDSTTQRLDSTAGRLDLSWNVSDPVPSGWSRHHTDDYTQAFLSMFPTGIAWPRDPDIPFTQFVTGLAALWGELVDQRAADLLNRESDPRTTIELLEDWERNWGLPDPCVAEPLTVEARRAALLTKMTLVGGQSRDFFTRIARTIGYDITIKEWSPFMAGVSRAGDTRETGTLGEPFRWEVGAPEMRFYWSIKVDTVRLSWFRAGSGQAGVDPHLRIGIATDLECLLNRYKPAHTMLLFDYSGLGTPDPMAGTP
jgi:uncharacterized protein YmfQ (DUF2313 family)